MAPQSSVLLLCQVSTRGGALYEKEWLDASLDYIAVVHLSRDCFGIDGAAERDGRAAKASSCHSGAEHAIFKANFFGEGNHEIEFITGNFKVIVK